MSSKNPNPFPIPRNNITAQVCSQSQGDLRLTLKFRLQSGSTGNDQDYESSDSGDSETSTFMVKSLHNYDGKLAKLHKNFIKKGPGN